jgi:hypothetical protein
LELPFRTLIAAVSRAILADVSGVRVFWLESLTPAMVN